MFHSRRCSLSDSSRHKNRRGKESGQSLLQQKLAERNDNVNCALAVKILSEDFVKQFDMIDWVERKTGLTVSMLTSGASLLYAFFHAPERKEMDEFCFGFFLIAVLEEVSRGRVPDHRQAIVLEALTKNEENQDVEIPVIKYKFRFKSLFFE
ncbi:hypothetical protein niasHT_011650 [Heterodera trifolii]|uniref:Ubiquitin-activating enzyme E1 C-terminal domain-containing protein n=1 Tax=Heterodera trifolii TaxID=157864 RepID=A0ABD2LJM9_9BILA